MPRMNGTGPYGAGPMSGWGMGPCGGGFRRGAGLGRGMGFGRRWTSVDEKTALEEEVGILEQELAEAKEELKNLKGRNK